jgi:hypothetical protein
MIRQIYAVYDLTANTYCNPFVMVNDETALREFATAANDPQSLLFKYPTEYALYRIASFDFDSGEVKPCLPTSLGIAAAYVIKPTIEDTENV